ncbi:hypothetical protein BV25DRAFT_1815961 [Artomyces pyxidatus]|uniref:Uncharacterized protein n=1 Tax=Artomyces pyxidatus TaxID=48021 RepID=A0ACB8SFD3_9AGAM|nr:hypothetical protein BV25DRAFT_1815961 [Artomyces pyxidatus]
MSAPTRRPLPTFSLPLHGGVPPSYEYDDRPISVISTRTAFEAGVDRRDRFFYENRCVVCGKADETQWADLKKRSWIPQHAKKHCANEPRNGLLMCTMHHSVFDRRYLYVQFFPESRRFVVINHSESADANLAPYHDKAIALDIEDSHAPFPVLFIIHEMRVRGQHPFAPAAPLVEEPPPWQDWNVNDGVYDSNSRTFKRDGLPPKRSSNSHTPGMQLAPVETSAGDALPGQLALPLNEDVIAKIVAATRAMPSWRKTISKDMFPTSA